jgi:hypothetical protein
LSRRIARFRLPVAAALIVSLVACNSDDTLNPVPSTTTTTGPTTGAEPEDQILTLTDDGATAAPAVPSEAAISFAGGIPMGTFAQPTSEFGSIYNGALRNIGTNRILSELSAIRSRGGKIVLMMAGSQPHYLNRDGSFSLSMWKERVNRYRNINLGPFINDGTIIAHYLIDEPYDAHNFGGKAVSGSTLEEMAKYSKSIWPNLKTVVRAEPYEIKWSGTYRALDAAWAQYLARKGNVNDYIQRNVSQAKQMGLGLVVGMNIVKGGTPNGTWMTPDEVEKYGSALLNTDYACAFISWQYNSDKLNNSAMRSAMGALRRKAENRGSRSCSG